MLGGFVDSFLAAGYRADLAGEADFAEDHQVLGQGAVAEGGNDGGQQRKVGTGFVDLDATNHVHEHILVRHMHAAMAVQYGKEHGQPVLVKANRNPSGVAALGHIHQGLDFHQHGASAFPDHHHNTPRGRVFTAVQEDSAGILHFLQALLEHGKYAQLIDRAKPVLDPPKGSITAVAGAFQQNRAVNHVFQDFRASQAAVFGDVANQEQDGAGLLGEPGQVGGAFANLGDTAGGRFNLRHMHHLNTVYHQNPGFFRLSHLHDSLDTGFRQHLQIFGRQTQPFGAHGDLLQRFLTGNVKRRDAGGQVTDGLKQKGALAGTRMAAHKHGRAFDQAAAQDPIELLHTGADAGLLRQADVVQTLNLG